MDVSFLARTDASLWRNVHILLSILSGMALEYHIPIKNERSGPKAAQLSTHLSRLGNQYPKRGRSSLQRDKVL